MRPSAERYAGTLLLAVTTLAAPAVGHVHRINPNTNLPYKWPASEYRFQVMLGTAPVLSDGTNYTSTFTAAAAAWNEVIGATQIVTVPAPPGPTSPANSINEVAFATTIEGMAFPSGALAVTLSRPGTSNRIAESDILFNAGRTFDSYRGSPRAQPEIRRIAIHELGHALGLLHPNESGQTVEAIMNSTPQTALIEILRIDDFEGARALYGPAATPFNDRFANANILMLAGSRATGVGWSSRGTLEPGEPQHAGNPGGRSVWWHWTAPASGYAVVDTRGSLFDTTVGVYTGPRVDALTTLAGNDDIENGVVQASEAMFLVNAGTTYAIAVDGFNDIGRGDPHGADSGSIRINLTFHTTAVTAPAITVQPSGATVDAGQEVNLSVTATGSEPFTYRWFRNNTAVELANGRTLRLPGDVVANLAGNYHVTVSNLAGTATSTTATVAVNTPPPPPPPPPTSPTSGGGGGGGAPSLWFLAALAALAGLRKKFRLMA